MLTANNVSRASDCIVEALASLPKDTSFATLWRELTQLSKSHKYGSRAVGRVQRLTKVGANDAAIADGLNRARVR